MKRTAGEGTIYKTKDGRWCAEVSAGYALDTGRRIRRKRICRTRQAAAEALADLRRRFCACGSSAKQYTLAEWLQEWLVTYKQPVVRENTFDTYSDIINAVATFPLSRKNIDKITPAELQQCINAILISKKYRKAQAVKQLLGSALCQAEADGLLVRSPATALTVRRKTKKEVSQVSIDEWKKILTGRMPWRWWPVAVMLLYCTGLRRSELLALRWSDFSADFSSVTVSKALIIGHNAMLIRGTKSAAGTRTLYLPDWIKKPLKWLKFSQGMEICFPALAGGYTHPDRLSSAFYKLRKNLSISTTLHGLRHDFCTRLVMSGADLKTITTTMGHSSVNVSLDIYTHGNPAPASWLNGSPMALCAKSQKLARM